MNESWNAYIPSTEQILSVGLGVITSDYHPHRVFGPVMQDAVVKIMPHQSVKHPCNNCVYFKVCGDASRTELCNGRKTKLDSKRERRK